MGPFPPSNSHVYNIVCVYYVLSGLKALHVFLRMPKLSLILKKNIFGLETVKSLLVMEDTLLQQVSRRLLGNKVLEFY